MDAAGSDTGEHKSSAPDENPMSETKDPGMSLQCEELKAILAATNESLVEKVKQIVYLTEHLDQATLKITSLENELVSLRSSLDTAIEEKNYKIYALETKTAELERLRSIYSETKTDIQKAFTEKSKAIALNDELQSKASVIQIEKHDLEKEKDFLNSQIRCLQDELDKLHNNLQTRSAYNSYDVIALTTQLDNKRKELKNAEDETAHLKEIINTLNETVDSLRATLKDKELDIPVIETYEKEMDGWRRAEMSYKNMQKEAETKLKNMEDASTQLKQLLRKSNDNYNDLEVKHKKFEMDHVTLLKKKDEVIASLKTELENTNDQNLHIFLSKLVPSAAATIKLLKPEMSLTQLYTQVVRATEDLAKEKADNTRLSYSIFTMEQELQNKESLLERHIAQHKDILEKNRLLKENLESQVEKSNNLKEVNIENNRLKGDLRHLAYQVCFLLNKIEECRSESVGKRELSNSENVPDIGSKALITFSDIQELQTNNQKLLRMVRDLKEKQDELETYKEQVNENNEYKKEIETLKKEMADQVLCNTKMLKNLMRQRDMFKKLYNDHIEGKRQECPEMMYPSLEVSAEQVKNTSMGTVTHEQKLKEVDKELESLKEEYSVYKEERANNENLLIEQMDNMRQEVVKLTGINCKSAIAIEYNNERLKIYKSNIDTYRSQIKSLEEKNKIYDNIISKHEISLQRLRDEVLNAQKHITAVNVKNENLNSEIELLKNIQNRIKKENDFLNCERLRQSGLMVYFEKNKISTQREERENQAKLKTKLDDATRECSTLKLRLKEEQDAFRELGSHLERQAKAAKTRMLEEKNSADTMRLEIYQLREKITELENKLIDPNSDKTQLPIDLVNKFEDLKNQISKKDIEIKALKGLLDLAKQTENEKNILSEEYKMYVNESEEKKTQFIQKIQVLHDYCSKLEFELSLRTGGENWKNNLETTNKLLTNEQLKDALNRSREELALVRSELTKSVEIQQAAMDKYNREIVLHSTDIQALSKVKEELSQLQAQHKEMIAIKNSAVTNLEIEKSCWDKREMVLQSENEQLLLRLKNLSRQNLLLHDQIKTLGEQLSSFTDSINDFANDSNVHTSIGNTEEVKSSVHLLEIITLLRQEKDIAFAKYDISKAEAMRLKLQLNNSKIRFDKMKLDSSSKTIPSETKMPTMNTQSDLDKKLETHNAFTDSNRILRIERNELLARVEALTASIKALEEQLLSLQEKVSALTSENEALQAENKLLKDYSTKQLMHLQKKNSALTTAKESLKAEIKLYKLNCKTKCKTKVNSDDWKRLQNERESLVKLLTKEKNDNIKFNEESISMKNDKAKIEEKYLSLHREHTALLESFIKLKEELSKVKGALITSQESNTKMRTDLLNKDAAILETRVKERKIVGIAKKYKALYEGLTKTIEVEKTQGQSAIIDSANIETGPKFRQQLLEIQNLLEAEKSRSESLKTELESLQNANVNIQKELKQANDKQSELTEANNYLTLELSKSLSKLEKIQQANRDEQDARLAAIRSHCETKLSNLEKEKYHTLSEKRELGSLGQLQLLSPTTITNQQANTTCDPSTANINITAGAAEQIADASGCYEYDPSDANSSSTTEETASTITESQDSAASCYMDTTSSSHSPEIVPSVQFRTIRTRSASNTTTGSAPVSTQSSSAPTTSQTALGKRTRSPRKPADPKRTKLQDKERSAEIEHQGPTSSRSDQTANEGKKDKESKPQAGSGDLQEHGEKTQGQAAGEQPTLPQIEPTTTSDSEPNTGQLSGADDGGDSIVSSVFTFSLPGSSDGAHSSTSSATSASGDSRGEMDQYLISTMPPPSAPAPSISGAPEAGVGVGEIVRGDLNPPLIRPRGTPPYWNHQREDSSEADDRPSPGPVQGRSYRSPQWVNRFNHPENQRGNRGNRHNRNRARYFRRPFF